MYIQPVHLYQPQCKLYHGIEVKEKVPSFIPQQTEQLNNNISLDTLQAYGNVSFGYSCELKRLVKKGKIKLKYSFYGGKLNPKKVSIEHIIPHSKGGKSCQSNYVLCNKEQNWERGNDPLEGYIDWQAAGLYLEQFKGLRVGGFNGDEYVKEVLNSINTALRTGR